MHTFKRGDKVSVINCTMGGKYIVEGRAVILKKIAGIDEQYRVRFLRNGEPSLGEEYERFVDPQAQQHPEWFVDRLNKMRAAKPIINGRTGKPVTREEIGARFN